MRTIAENRWRRGRVAGTMIGMSVPTRQVRARFDASTVTVYQAYRADIAVPAAATGRFPDAFKRERMTWIKPSFLWMMYRSGWASKPGQEHVLAVTITREGFEWALRHSALARFDRTAHTDRVQWRGSLTAPVRIQWDPERDIRLSPLPYRSLQVGLSGEAVRRYCDEWIVGIEDVTELAHETRSRITAEDESGALGLIPSERPYPIPDDISQTLGMAQLPR
ncbi:DUF4291 domain-containing protein [Nocardia sp. GTS18]|uniref:DUF4291 domain-containing protein n=1 Tax=Nocardia sp. GTS18 TaxID=1778064 RepID=UPI00351A1D37